MDGGELQHLTGSAGKLHDDVEKTSREKQVHLDRHIS